VAVGPLIRDRKSATRSGTGTTSVPIDDDSRPYSTFSI